MKHILKTTDFKGITGGLFLGILIVGVLLRFLMLSNQSLWIDEGITLEITKNLNLIENLSMLLKAKQGQGFQPLYFLIMPYWRFVFGDSEFALRLMSALPGSATVILLSLIALRVYGRTYALWCAALATFSAFAVFYSQDARPYALLIFLATTQVYFLGSVLCAEKNDKVSRWGFWITTMLGLFASIFTFLFTAALALSHLIIYRDWKHWLRWWIPAVLFALPAITFYFFSFLSTPQTSASHYGFSILEKALFVPYGILVGQTYGPPIESLHSQERWQAVFSYLPELLVLLLVFSIIAVFLLKVIFKKSEDKQRQNADWFFASLLVISFVLAFLFAMLTQLWLPRHSFFLWIPFVLLIPALSRLNNKSGFLAKGVLTMLIVLNVYSLSNYFFKHSYRKDDYRAVAQYLTSHASPNIASVILWGKPSLLAYYGDTKTLVLYEGGKHFAEKISNKTQHAQTVFIVVNNEFYWQKQKKITVKKAMSGLYTLNSSVSFPNFIIYRFHRKMPMDETARHQRIAKST